MTGPQARDLVWSVSGGIAGYLAFLAVVLLALSLIGMVRR
jgi:hypothetical protein